MPRPPRSPQSRPQPRSVADDRIFVTHGHAEAARESVARFLEQLELKPIILHEQASGGQSLSQKLARYSNVSYAIIIMTPDDVGASKDAFDSAVDKATAVRPRARQNVVHELGLFTGKLGGHRVCVLHSGQLEMPSNVDGVVYIPMDKHGGWKLQLVRELKDAGFAIDMNNVR